jgi:hypothetical protein
MCRRYKLIREILTPFIINLSQNVFYTSRRFNSTFFPLSLGSDFSSQQQQKQQKSRAKMKEFNLLSKSLLPGSTLTMGSGIKCYWNCILAKRLPKSSSQT